MYRSISYVVEEEYSLERLREVGGEILRRMRRYVAPRLIMMTLQMLLKYKKPINVILASQKRVFGAVHAPVILTTKVSLITLSVAKRYLKIRSDPEQERQLRLIDKLAFDKIKFMGEELTVYRTPVRSLSLRPLLILAKSVIPRKYNTYSTIEQLYLRPLRFSGFLIKKGREYYTNPEIIEDVVKKLERTYLKLKNLAYQYLSDLAAIEHNREDLILLVYKKSRTISSDDLLRVKTYLLRFKEIPIMIFDKEGEEILEMIDEALKDPKSIKIIT